MTRSFGTLIAGPRHSTEISSVENEVVYAQAEIRHRHVNNVAISFIYMPIANKFNCDNVKIPMDVGAPTAGYAEFFWRK